MTVKVISLHYQKGTSDKVYHLQVVPNKADPTKWDLLAQNGRRGGPLTRRVKLEGVSAGKALFMFDEIVADKKRSPGYWVIPDEGPSLEAMTLAATSAPKSAPPMPAVRELPTWEGWEEGYIEAATFIGVSANTKSPHPGIVIMGDLCQNMQEGAYDAATLLSKSAAEALGSSDFSPECRAYMAALGSSLATALNYIRGMAKATLADLS